MAERLNEDLSGRLGEVAWVLAAPGATRLRVGAYERAAITIRREAAAHDADSMRYSASARNVWPALVIHSPIDFSA